ncbi:MAG: sugar phosphate nucleotidyltransferase [Kofleriaceae bacterium]
MTEDSLRYVVVLAGGEGRRLASLTRALYGTDLPKQFAVLAGERSLLQTTIERAKTVTALERISVVVTAHHEAIARDQLARCPEIELIVQPRNLDTGPGMLLPLARILARSPDACVVFMPSDHHMSNSKPVTRGLDLATAGILSDRVTLVGVAPNGPEVDYGWIVPGDRIAQTEAFEIRRFHEKPSHELARELWRAGGLWNTFISAGRASVFWDLARRHLPDHAAAFERYATEPSSDRALDAAYRSMAPANFSRDVLAYARSLAVLPVSGSGWSDWGSPARVFASLAGTESHDRLVDRIRGELAP